MAVGSFQKQTRGSAFGRSFALPALIALVAGALLLAGVGIWTHQALQCAQRYFEASRRVRDLDVRIREAAVVGSRLRSTDADAEGDIARLGHPEEALDQVARIRELVRDNPEAQRRLDAAGRFTALAVTQARAVLLLDMESKLAPAAPGTARARDLEQGAAEAHRKLEAALQDGGHGLDALEAAIEGEATSRLAAGRWAEVLLIATAALVLLLAWRLERSWRLRKKHLEGARLVEDMLEAYSRRLESMNAELEQVNLLKTQFLANTSHELLTPLNGIMGSLELLREGACAGPEEEREFLNQAYLSAERLLSLIHDLLDLCNLEEGNLALRCRTVEFGPILERSLAANRGAMEKLGLTLLTLPPAEGWPRIQADSERLQQVIHHLVSNAVKFTAEGSIRISGRTELAKGPRLRLEVADTGIGIEPDKLSKVFDLFSQADGSSTRRFGGTGLGLTLSRHLVRGMGGEIGIESEGAGRGTRAWFTIPLARPQEGAWPDRDQDLKAA